MILIVCFSSLSSEVSPRPTGFDFMCRIQAGKEGTRQGGSGQSMTLHLCSRSIDELAS